MRHKHAIIVSVFITLSIAILVLCILTLGTQRNAFARKLNIRVNFDDINGLQAGNNVWLSGVKIGTVSNIQLSGINDVEVTLSIDEKQQKFIHNNARAKISSDGFIGNKIVVIYGGTKDAKIINKNDFLLTEKAVGTGDMMATLQLNNKNLLNITENIKTITDSIANGHGLAGTLINDVSLANNLKKTVANFKTTSVNSNTFTRNLLAFSDEFNNSSTTINKLVKDTALFYSIAQVISGLEKITDTANLFLHTLNMAGQNIQAATGKLTTNNNTAGMLLNDDSTAAQVRGLLKNLNESSQKLNDDLEALQHNFLLRGYFRKKEKALKK